jgi:hypothetical protein
MNAQTLILTITQIEATTDDVVVNAERVLSALERLKGVPGFGYFLVRSAIRTQKEIVESLKNQTQK